MTGSGEVTVEALGLTKRFGGRTAVADVSFVARRGEVLGLLGRNGAGKTTTVRLLTTVLTPTSGDFRIAGLPSGRPRDIRRVVGVLPESAGYPARLTGLEYLRNFGRLYGLSAADAARVAERLLAEVGLADRATSPISTYSRGMRQRLGIGRALVNDPEVVFLDEPTLGLDPAGQRHVLELVRDIAQHRAATVILSTHTLPDVEEVCTTVLILDEGAVLVSGTVGEVTRAAAAPRSGQLRVPPALVGPATRALAEVEGLAVEASEARPELLRIALDGAPPPGRGADVGMNRALAALIKAGVPVLSFELEGGRLNDAFLAMTRAGRA
jgi:ABC-2 type transport system ATP-binding protein